MSDHFDKLDLPQVSFWMNGANSQALCKAAQLWFQRLGDAAIWPARQCHPMTCSLPVLDLLAWQRGVTRFIGESNQLYRMRVTHAYANAKDSGQTSGWQKILERLELLGPGVLTLSERITGQDWDIIGIELSDQQLSELQEVLFKVMIPEYGRTCRRYTPISRATESIHLLVGTFDDAHTTLEATLPQCALAINSSSDIFDNEYTTVEAAIWQ